MLLSGESSPQAGSDIMIEVKKVDDVSMKILCEDRGILKEISQFFTFTVPGAEHMPAYKKRRWDGKIKLFSIHTQELPVGLYDYLVHFCSARSYGLSGYIPSKYREVGVETIQKYVDDFLRPVAGGNRVNAHPHQIEAITHAIENFRTTLLSPTGSGKSLIIYALVRFYLDMIPEDKKVLIVVPTTSLVSQMYSDFEDYSAENGWDVASNCHKVTAGKDKSHPDKRVVISTWQSIYKLDYNYFDQFRGVIGDECHLFKSKSLTTLMAKLRNCPYRVGTTGTLDGTKVHKLVIEGAFGPTYQVTSTKDLIDKAILSDFAIDCVLLRYPDHFRHKYKRITYQEEIDLLVQCEFRNEFITDLVDSLKGNTLVLFQYVQKHGIPLHKMIEEKAKGRKVFLIHGGTDADSREEVRKIVETEKDAVIVASYGTFSTGVSIRRLHNIVFASPSKSRVRVLQSIGRQLRKSEHKEVARLYDISDDMQWLSYKNHTFRHYEERLNIYESENFNHKSIFINIGEPNKEDPL
jgi:superfamily II DNA or RNA helicase